MKILFYIESLRSGGKERRLVELIKGLSSHSSVELGLVLTKEIIHYEDILSTNIKIYYTLKKGFKKAPRIFYQFYKIAREFKPDIIHVWGNINAIYAIPTKVFLKIPMVNNQITNAPLKVSNSLIEHKLTFLFSDKIIANTYAGLEVYDAPKHKSEVIYNGFDFTRVDKLENKSLVRKRFDIQTKYIVGMIASFNEKKDYKTYLKAANSILNKYKDVTFLCIGSGNYSKLERMVKQDNKNKILFLGKQNNVESIMNICNIGVLMTSEKHGEGISNAILEFSALGKPVIATFGGGNSEIIKDGISGYLIKPKSSDELVDKLFHFLNNEKDLINFGENAKRIVVKKFSIIRMIDEFKAIYKEIIT